MYVLGYSGFTRDSRSSIGVRNPFSKTKQGFDGIFDFREGEVPFQMFPLGFFGHDAAAALIKDGTIVACAAEERFNRVKFSLNLAGNTLLPKNAIEFCLKSAKISIREVDVVAHYCSFTRSEIEKRLLLLKPYLSEQMIAMVRDSYEKTYDKMMDRRIVLDQFTRMAGHQPANFVQVNHHLAHAASAFYPSGFAKSLIFTIDGCGETESSLLAIGINNSIHEIRRVHLPNSLGTLYLILSVFLGFKSLGDEYKVMALAGYGNPENYRGFFRLLIHPEDDGSYSMPLIASGDLKALLIDNLGQPRKPKDPIEKRHQDIAAALQEALQETVLHVLQHLRKETNISMLCMAGGVALNSVLNGAIAKSGLFDDIFVQPASSDEGSSLGAAYYAYMQKYSGQCHRMPKLDQVYLGPSYRKSEIVKSLEVFANHLTWKYTKNLCEAIASEIASGKVVGWFQGRMEFGPRALGNRSILADPRPSGMRDRINQKIKHREEFRPFAPAILEEDAEAFFQMNGLRSSPFMLFVVPVRKEQRASIPAVVHVDGTARIQTVSRRTNGKFWHLLAEFKKLTGFPVILNTSFNVMNEPIVCTPTDAIRCYLSTDIDLLVLGNYVVKKRGSSRVFSF